MRSVGRLKRGWSRQVAIMANAQERVLPEGDQSATRVVGAQAALHKQGSELERKEEEDEQEGWLRGWVGCTRPGAAGNRVSPGFAGHSE